VDRIVQSDVGLGVVPVVPRESRFDRVEVDDDIAGLPALVDVPGLSASWGPTHETDRDRASAELWPQWRAAQLLRSCLPAVAGLAEGLPVRSIPEQREVSVVRYDVVDLSGKDNEILCEMELTEGMSAKVPLACLLPSVVVETLA